MATPGLVWVRGPLGREGLGLPGMWADWAWGLLPKLLCSNASHLLPVSWHRWCPACTRRQGRRLQPLVKRHSVLPCCVLAVSGGQGDALGGG